MRIESGRMLNDYIQPNKKQYCIPVFQRDYAWTTEQCEKLFEDIVLAFKKDRLHFCGSFVYAPLPTRKHIDRYIIIDGQQRFTTLYILIKALADSATDEADKAALEKYLYNEDKFNRYGFDDKSKLKLKPVKTDNDQLQLLMAGKLDKMNKAKDGIIYHNYMLFKELITAFLAEDPSNSIMMIHDGIDNLICADIKLDHDDDAQEIFERINSTGIKLGLPDLIRNYVLMTDDDQERLYEEYWLVMQELLSKDRMDSTKPQGEFFDYIDIDAIDNRLHQIKAAKHLPVSEAPSRASRAVRTGSVLFSLVRPYLENIALVEEQHSGCIASTGFYVCNSNGVLLPEFMYYLMISGYVVNGLNQYMKGDNSPSISKENIENWLYPVPPLKEQKAICTKLRISFNLIENVEKSLS